MRAMSKCFAVAAVLLTFGSTVFGSSITISNSQPQNGSDFSFAPNPYGPPSNSPFDYTATPYLSLANITKIEFTVTVFDGDTGIGEFDNGDITLHLDGIDTGILVDGLLNQTTSTVTVSGIPPLNAAAILAALQADGKLIATLIDADSGDNGPFTFSSNFDTTLSITGDAIPEPTTLAIFGIMGVCGYCGYRRRQQPVSA